MDSRNMWLLLKTLKECHRHIEELERAAAEHSARFPMMTSLREARGRADRALDALLRHTGDLTITRPTKLSVGEISGLKGF